MGDLGNVMNKANEYTPNTQITGKCESDQSLDLVITVINNNSIGINIPYECKLYINNTTLIQTINFDGIFQVAFSLSSEYLISKISYATLIGTKYKPEGEFIVTNEVLATQIIRTMIGSLVGSTTLGNKFPTVKRNRGAVFVNENYITMYDPSEV